MSVESTEKVTLVKTGPRRPQRFVVGRVDDFPADGRLIVDVNGREVGIFKVDGEYFAILNRCPHLAGPLCVGQVVNEVTSTGPGNMDLNESMTILTCPWHNWEFDIRTGQSYWDPDNLHARAFPATVEHGGELAEQVNSGQTGRVKGPYKAEMIDVAVESDYIVLSMKALPRRKAAATDSVVAPACATPDQEVTTK